MARNCRKNYSLFVSVAFIVAITRINAEEIPCDDTEFPCDNGGCIKRERWCDRVSHCRDYSDELYCYGRQPCLDHHFRCNDGSCIPLSAKCDRIRDCRDGSDEICEMRCRPGEIRCVDKCILQDDWCNGKRDCTDGSDEKYCKTVNWYNIFADEFPNKCGNDLHTCKSGICFPRSVRCDGFRNCYDGSDEKDCHPSVNRHFVTENNDQMTMTTATESNFGKEPDLSGTEDSSFERRWREFDTPSTSAPEIDINSMEIDTDFYHSYVPVEVLSTTNPPDSYETVTHSFNIHHNIHPRIDYPSNNNGDHSEESYNNRDGRTSPEHSSVSTRFNGQNGIHATNYNFSQGHQKSFDSGYRLSETKEALTPFYFAKNYHEEYSSSYKSNIRQAEDWLISQRDVFHGWEEDTSRALVALSLINNTLLRNSENELLKKQFEVHLGFQIMRNNSSSLRLNKLAQIINAMLATCLDPRSFYEVNFVHELRKQVDAMNGLQFVNPIVLMSLCLANEARPFDVRRLERFLNPQFPNEESAKGMQTLAITALACYIQQPYYSSARSAVKTATEKLLQRQLADGSFGTVYNTALAIQALFSTNITESWNPDKSLQYLSYQQKEDGSFGDFLATYLALPALSGRSLIHLRNTKCGDRYVQKDITPLDIINNVGPKRNIRYSLYFGNPMRNYYTISVRFTYGTSLFDIMRVGEYLDNRFRFSFDKHQDKISVVSINDIPDDSQLGTYWNLHVTSISDDSTVADISNRIHEDIGSYYPQEGDHVIFWYY